MSWWLFLQSVAPWTSHSVTWGPALSPIHWCHTEQVCHEDQMRSQTSRCFVNSRVLYKYKVMHLQSSHSNKDTHSIKQNIFKKFLTRYKYNHKIIHWLKQSLQYLQQNSDAYSSLQIVTYVVLTNTVNTNAWFTISPLQQDKKNRFIK